MSDPDTLDKLKDLAQSEAFQDRMKQMSSDPAFAEAAGKYADEMKSDMMDAVAGAGEDDAGADAADAATLGDDHDLGEDEEEPLRLPLT